jgi:heptosyltransferase I
MEATRILAVRLGAMGDIVHALPAVATLKHSFPRSRLCWAVEPRWAPLLEGNPFVDDIIPCERKGISEMLATRRRLRSEHFDLAVDFQGLLKSALVASAARPERIVGYDRTQVREKVAAIFYSHKIRVESAHVVDRNLELAVAAGATNIVKSFPLPQGEPEGHLPNRPFVLASPLAGWGAKQWPLEHYSVLAGLLQQRFGMSLVLNGHPSALSLFHQVPGVEVHISGVKGLIHATRCAAAVIGVDSGPMHIAAALDKPGVAILGPTDPARNGPYGSSMTVLRSPGAVTTYKRKPHIDESMREITPAQVLDALALRLEAAANSAKSSF